MIAAPSALLTVADLKTYFYTQAGIVKSVDGVSLTLNRGETLAVVGESGSGKSVTSLSILRLIASPGKIVEGAVKFSSKDGMERDLAQLPEPEMRSVRGNEISMIFQEPMSSLNPVFSIGDQIAETIVLHRKTSKWEALNEAARMLDLVGIPAARQRLREYPHQMSGGMRQRIMIAIALSCEPALLIADEPTTALDVTVQAQILDLLRRLQADTGMGILFITHNLAAVAEIADRVAVMYGGRIVESASTSEILRVAKHPYTRGLLNSVPRANSRQSRLEAIPGSPPNPLNLPPGCAFEPRCQFAIADCRKAVPVLEQAGAAHLARCIRHREI